MWKKIHFQCLNIITQFCAFLEVFRPYNPHFQRHEAEICRECTIPCKWYLLNKLGFVESYGPKMAFMPIFGHTFFDHITQLFFWPIGLELFLGGQEIIIYRLLIINRCYDGYSLFLGFLATFWWENGCGRRVSHKDMGPQIQLKSRPTRCIFWVIHC